MYNDFRNVVRILQAHVLPGSSAINTLVDSISDTDVATAYIFPSSYPDRMWIAGINGHAADRVGGLVVKDGGPGNACVLGFPTCSATRSAAKSAMSSISERIPLLSRRDSDDKLSMESNDGEVCENETSVELSVGDVSEEVGDECSVTFWAFRDF